MLVSRSVGRRATRVFGFKAVVDMNSGNFETSRNGRSRNSFCLCC